MKDKAYIHKKLIQGDLRNISKSLTGNTGQQYKQFS